MRYSSYISLWELGAVMEPPDLVSRLVSRRIFASLGLSLEDFRSHFGLGLDDFKSRDLEYCKEMVY